MKRIISLFCAVLLAVPAPVNCRALTEPALSGGTPLLPEDDDFYEDSTPRPETQWTLENGVLTVSGDGIYTSYGQPMPWDDRRAEITEAVIGENIRGLPNGAFQDCTELRKVTLPDGLTYLGGNCFWNCTALTEITLPPQLEIMEYGCFRNCTSLEQIEIPGKVQHLEYNFVGCTALRQVRFLPPEDGASGWLDLCNDVFRGCTSLETVALPENLRTLGTCCFEGCTALKALTLPETLQSVGTGVFENCTALETIRIPAQIYWISGMFRGCTSLRAVTFAGRPPLIDGECFAGCAALEQIRLSPWQPELEARCFAGCASLQTITLPDGLRALGDECFADCTALEQVIFPDGVQLGADVFRGAERLLTKQDGFAVLGGYFLYDCLTDDRAAVTLPAGVTAIRHGLFQAHPEITSVTLPAGFTRLPDEAFRGCETLETVGLPDSLRSIGAACFADCIALRRLTLPAGLERLGEGAFSGCAAYLADHTNEGFTVAEGWLLAVPDAVHLVIPAGVVRLADGACRGAAAVRADCPDSLRHIGAGVFADCTALVDLRLNDGLLSIGAEAFSGCQNLRLLTVPDSVRQIGSPGEWYVQTLRGSKGSYADEFAHRQGVSFADDARPAGADLTLDLSRDVWAFGNSGAVFGETYRMTDADRALADRMMIPGSNVLDGAWKGSCFGLAAAVVLARTGRFDPAALVPGAVSLAELEPTPEVISFINYCHGIQHNVRYTAGNLAGESDAALVYRLAEAVRAVPAGGAPALLVYTAGEGSHAVVAYALESGSWDWDGRSYDSRVLVWDSNFPGEPRDDVDLYFDSSCYDFCIPAYGIAGGEQGSLVAVCSDPAMLCGAPHPAMQPLLPGDLSGDGRLNLADAVLMQRLLAEYAPPSAAADADLNGDGLLDTDDLFCLLAALRSAE